MKMDNWALNMSSTFIHVIYKIQIKHILTSPAKIKQNPEFYYLLKHVFKSYMILKRYFHPENEGFFFK